MLNKKDNEEFEMFLKREYLVCSVEGLKDNATLENAKDYFLSELSKTTIERNEAKKLIIEGLEIFTGGHEYMREELIELVKSL